MRSIARYAATAALAGHVALAGAAIAQQVAPALAPTPHFAKAAQPIDVAAKPITHFERLNSSQRIHGRLEFRGGLVLSAQHGDFGGFSGLIVSDDGRQLLTVSDRGWWLSADLQYDGTRPMGLANAKFGEVQGQGGQAMRFRERDSEAITLLEGNLTKGTALVGFERNHRIGRYQITDRGLGLPLGFMRLPAEARRMSANKGFEAVAAIRTGPLRGQVIAFSEEMLDAQRNHTGWLWPTLGGDGVRISLTNIGDFAITDVAALPDGNLIILERKFRWLEGVRMRLRMIKAEAVKPGAVLDGEILHEADLASEIDNMEGLAVHRDARGQTVLTLISDNNFNGFLQRTLLLQFTLLPPTVTKAEPTTTTRQR